MTCGAIFVACGTWILLGSDDAQPVASAVHAAGGQEFESREAEIADAIDKNGEIFSDWPKPQLALVFSGQMDGYLEPCGCAGLDNQKGGLKRRYTFLKKLAADGWPVVAFDMGGQIRRFGPQADIKYRFAMKALNKLGYQAVGLGVRELQLDANYLAYVIANFEDGQNPVVAANVSILDADYGLTSRYRVSTVGGKKVGVTAVVGKKHQPDLQNAREISWTEPAPAIEKVLDDLQAEQCDLLVLMVHADPEEATALAKQFPQFHFIATTGGAETPPNRLISIEENATQEVPAYLIEAGHKGQYLTVVGIYDDPNQPMLLQRVPLDHRFEDDPQMQQLLVEYQDELKTLGLEGLGLSDSKHPVDSFVGSAACADCHSEATEVFEVTPHAHATQTLLELDPPRHFDPECLSCHVTGWNPQEYFPYASGFKGLKETPHLLENGCENCHGPGASHVAAENGEVEADEEELERLRAAMRLKIVENEGNRAGQEIKTAVVVKMCMSCHDLDNSPEFDFQDYWPHVEHYGKD
ncbi:MAG: multiheme c-type cytochrome [Bythopirellula sp.]